MKQKGVKLPSDWKRPYIKSSYKWSSAFTRVLMLEGHKGPVNCVDSDEDFILSGSRDTTIHVSIKTSPKY